MSSTTPIPSTTTTTASSKRKSKKPYHIPRSELDLDSYIEEQESKDVSLFFSRLYAYLATSVQLRVYLALQAVAALAGYGQVMFIVGLFWAMLANTTSGQRKNGQLSAYSLFNKGAEAIEGSTDMEALERELRTRGG